MTTNAIKPLPPERKFVMLFQRENNVETVPVDAVLLSDYRDLRSYTEDCLARLRVAVGFMQAEREVLAESMRGTTHWPDCHKDHPKCARLKAFDEALATIGPLEGEKQGG